jgi:glucoamylase
MPLAWAHSEYIKLLRSLHSGEIWDRIPQTEERYQRLHRTASFQIWTPEQRRAWLTQGKNLRLDLTAPAKVQWTAGRAANEAHTVDSGCGLHCAMLNIRELPPEAKIRIKIEPVGSENNEKPKPESFTVRIRT